MLYNVGTSQYLTRGNGWNTQASITTATTIGNGIAVQLEAVGSDFKIRTNINGDGKGLEHLAGGTVYTDQSQNKNSTWTFSQVGTDNGPVYTIVSADNHGGGAGAFLTAGADGTIVTPGSDGTIDGAKWKLMSLPTQPIGMESATAENPVDATTLIVNANFSFPAIKQDAWTMVSGNYNPCGGDVTNPCAESWRATFTLSQTLTVPNGVYELRAQAALTDYTNAYDGTNYPVVYANDVTAPFNNMNEADRGTSMTQLSGSFTNGSYGVGPLRVIVTNGSLTIGVRGTRTDTWCIWDNFTLKYYGLDLSELKAALQAQIDAVPALEGTTTAAAYNAAKNYADGINMDALTTEEAISTASTELAALVDAAKALQSQYSRYQTIKAAALAAASETETDEADAAVGAATTNDAINAAIATLRQAFLNELPNVTIPSDPGYIDVTAVMVDNAGVHTNTDYWTIEGTPNGGYSFGVCNYGECEFYNNNFKFYQTLTLNSGTWEFGVTGFHRAGNHNTHFYAGEDKILIPGVENTVVNSMAEAQTYFNNGNGKVALKFLLEEDKSIEIGIDNQDTQTDKWTIFRDFTLKYYGAPDYSVYDQQWADAVAAANEALEAQAYKYISGNERTAVTEAIANEPVAGDKKAQYLEKIQALQDATATFKAAAPSYNAWVLAKTETTNLWGSTLGVAAPTTAAEAAAGVNALNIAQYNKVADEYTYSATGLIGDFGSWTGTATVAGEPAEPNYLSNEHWSGQTHAYYEQAASGWGNAGGWTIKYEKTCILPAGDYVIKVAARSSVDVTSSVSCTATDNTISLPNVGNSGRGITKSGVASWADNDEFIASTAGVANAGAGWQWRFLPFTLDEETEVTMTFYAETNKQYNWMSISDGELLSTDKLAEDVAYDETANNTIENTIIADVTIARNVKEGLNTVVLPFALTANQVIAAFGTGAEVYNFSEASTDPMDATVNFNKGDGSITANVPVLVNATTASTEQTFQGVQIVAATEAKVEGTNFDFVGVYAPMTVDEGDYFVSGGKLYKSAGSTNLKAFRAYIDNKTNGEGEVKLYIDGVATAISEINADVQESGAIYNLAGQRVSKAQKGIYVINGRKVVVK